MPESDIGGKLREFRLMRHMTVRGLSEASGITASMISQIENNQANPSIATLRSLVSALDVPLWKFFQSMDDPNIVVHPKDRFVLGQTDSDNEVRYELLTPDTSGNIEMCMMKIPGHAQSAAQAASHAGEEVSYVIKGPIKVEVASATYVLNDGDSILIKSNVCHRWINETDKEAEVVFAVTPPGF